MRIEPGSAAQVQYIGSDVVITFDGAHQTVLVGARVGPSPEGWLVSA